MSRTITTDVDNILSLISCAEDYGHTNQIIMVAFRDLLETLSDEEIEAYAAEILADADYGEEDAENVRECLHEFRDRYMAKS